jgi:hypothetical protein
MPELPELPEEITPEHAKIGILGLAAIAGGLALGNAVAQKAPDIREFLPEKQSTGQAIAAVGAGIVGFVLFGKMLKDAFDEYGAQNVALASGGIAAAVIVIRAVRS